MTIERLFVAALATWRITHLLMIEDGPFDVFTAFRTALGNVRALSPLLECIWCMSFWVGALVAVVVLSDWWFILLPFALSMAAVVGERCLGHR